MAKAIKRKLIYEANTAAAAREIDKLRAAEDKATAANQRLARQSKRTDRAMENMGRKGSGALEGLGRGIGRVAGMLGVTAGLGLAVSKISGGFQKWQQYMREVGQEARRAGQEMTALAMMQEGGLVRTRVMQATRLGTRYGVEMGPAWGAVQAYQAKTGTFAQGLAAAEAAFALRQAAEVPLEGARAAVSVGMGLGLTPAQAARAAYAAGEASQLSPAELAEMAGKGLPAYQGIGGGPVAGYGIAAALSGLISDPGMLATYTRQIGTLLQQRTGKVGETWAKLGFERPGQEPQAQLRALHGAGIRTMGDLQAAGFAKKEALGLSIILADLDAALATIETTRRLYEQPGLIGRRRAMAEAEMPEMRFARKLAITEQRMKEERTFGRYAPMARRRELVQKRLGIVLEREGLGWFADEEGRASGWDLLWLRMLTAGDVWVPEEERVWPRIQRGLQATGDEAAWQAYVSEGRPAVKTVAGQDLDITVIVKDSRTSKRSDVVSQE